MVEIPCLVCEKPLKFPSYINPDNYDGQLVCNECGSLLHIKLVASEPRKYRLVKKGFKIQPIQIITAVPRPNDSEETKNENAT